MPLRLLLDECIGQRALADLLKTAGHDVVRVVDALEPGVDDGAVFDLAQEEARVLITYNAVDFRPMAQAKKHAGLVLIYQANAPSDMNVQQIADAFCNVAQTYPDGIENVIIALNDFNWKGAK